jgi:biuret amidohydrolase
MDLDPRTTAVVAVHCQGDIIGPDGAFADFFHAQVRDRDVVPRMARLLGAARNAGATVVYTRVAFRPDFGDLPDNSPLLRMVRQRDCLKDGTRSAEIIEPLAPAAADLVLANTRVGGFSRGLAGLLDERGVDTVVIAGVATNISVESTARAASDHGLRVVVAEDACAAATPEAHQASIASLGLLVEIGGLDDLRWATAPVS